MSAEIEGIVMGSRTTWFSVGVLAVVEPKRWNGRAVVLRVNERRVNMVLSERCIVDCGYGL